MSLVKSILAGVAAVVLGVPTIATTFIIAFLFRTAGHWLLQLRK